MWGEGRGSIFLLLHGGHSFSVRAGGGRECFVFAVWAVGEGERFFLLSGRCVCVCVWKLCF